ncbi:MAG: alpha/beta hydrolase [Pseudomonadota bacterium]
MVSNVTGDEQLIFPGERAKIAYFDLAAEGDERGIVFLIHGFASTAQVNWIGTGWTDTLRKAGYRVIALDNRGHGASEKFYTPNDYGPDIFAADALELLDHLGIGRCCLMGYSMGARISSWLAHVAPERFPAVVFGGMGEHIYGGRGGYLQIAEALEADDPNASLHPAAKGFRIFADRVGADRLALAACIHPSAQQITRDIVSNISVPVLVAVGDEDEIGGSAEKLAAQMRKGEAFVIEGKDHMKAVGDPSYKKRVLAFFEAHS